MESMRDIKRRINSVESTRKITRAMKMVAAAKLRNSQKKAEDARAFFQKTRKILADIVEYTVDAREHPLLIKKDGKRHLYILITGDRGLCGAYNHRIIDLLENNISEQEETNLLTIGKKGSNYFNRRGFNIISEYIKIADYPDYGLAKRIGDEVISLYKDDIVDKVSLLYTHFDSALSQKPNVMSLLPVNSPEETEEYKHKIDYIYEPSPVEVLDNLLPQYINNILYSALLESKASEYGARMTAMDSATENANEMIDELTLSYNRARQAEITTEITEIVGGAEALK